VSNSSLRVSRSSIGRIQRHSVQDITDAAGAPKGSFYNHFESKEALAVEVVRKYEERSAARLSILKDEKLAPLRRLRKYFESLNQAAIAAKLSAGCLLGNFGAELSGQSPLVCKRVGEAFDRWTDHVAPVIAEAQKAARSLELRAEGARGVRHPCLGGAMLRAKVEKDRAPLELFLKVTFMRILA